MPYSNGFVPYVNNKPICAHIAINASYTCPECRKDVEAKDAELYCQLRGAGDNYYGPEHVYFVTCPECGHNCEVE